MSVFNPERLILARESRGINQQELNEQLGLAHGTLSKVENGSLGLSPDAMERLSAITEYPINFFYEPGGPAPIFLAWRQREKVNSKLVSPITAQVGILRLQVQMLTRALKIKTPLLPSTQVSEHNTPADIARSLRESWDFPRGPVDNLTAMLEKKGIPVATWNFGTDRIDSRATLTDDRHPLFCVNGNHTSDRQRFTLAYQLGHLVMHTFTTVKADQDTGHEANLFAAELLMPEAEFREAVEGQTVSLPLLGELKRTWKVSMISLLYRCDDLGYTTYNQKRYIVTQFNQLNLRRREPIELDFPPEHPNLIRSWLATLKRREKLDTSSLASRMQLTTSEFIQRFN